MRFPPALVPAALKAPAPPPTSAPASLGQRPYYLGAEGQAYPLESRKDFVDAYINRVWVRRCVDLISNSVDKVCVELYRGSGPDDPDKKKIEGEHPLRSLLDRPCPRDPALTFFSASVKWGQMVGDWCWEVVPARGGGISALYPLRSYLVEIAPDQEGGISHFLYDPNENGQKVKLAYADPKKPPEKETAIFGRLGNPLDDLYGMSPLRAAKDDIVSEYYAVRYDQRFFRNSARPDLLVGIEGATEEEMQMNKEAWQQFKGADKAHRAAFMAGKPNVTLLSQNQRDVEYLEGRKLAREGECGAFGVPPILVGILDRATYSNLAESKVIFWGETMVPLLSYTASWVNAALVPFFPDVDFLEFDLDDIEALQENQTDKEDRALKRLASGAASIDETREALDEEPLGTPEAAQLYLPANLVPVASTEGEMQPEEPPAPELPPSNGMPAGIPTQEDIARMLLEGQPPPAPAQQP